MTVKSILQWIFKLHYNVVDVFGICLGVLALSRGEHLAGTIIVIITAIISAVIRPLTARAA